MSTDVKILLAMALTAAAVIWFLEQRNTQTTATEAPSGVNTSSGGSP